MALSRMFEGTAEKTPRARCAALWKSLPLAYIALEGRQREDPTCIELRERVLSGAVDGVRFQLKRKFNTRRERSGVDG
jgi:hypothetical protein